MAELHVVGSILGASDFSEAGLYCKFSFESSLESDLPFQTMAGFTSGTTHLDAAGGSGVDAVWDHPIDVHFAVPTLVGWPRLRVEVWNKDSNDCNVLCGYGFANVPLKGVHDIDIVTWRPYGSFGERLSGWFLGARPHLVDSGIVAQTQPGENRFGLKTVTTGVVYVHVEVLTYGLGANGVDV